MQNLLFRYRQSAGRGSGPWPETWPLAREKWPLARGMALGPEACLPRSMAPCVTNDVPWCHAGGLPRGTLTSAAVGQRRVDTRVRLRRGLSTASGPAEAEALKVAVDLGAR